MEKPAIKSGPVLDYVNYLEAQLDAFKTHTKKKFYLGIQRQLDLLGDEMLQDDFKVSMKKSFTINEGKSSMVDSGFDGFFDMLTKGEAIIKAMEKFEAQAIPKEEKDNGPKLKEGSVAEKYIFDK